MNFSEHDEYYFSMKDLRRGNCLSLSIASSPRQDVLKNTKFSLFVFGFLLTKH